jgi:hypothetical protein
MPIPLLVKKMRSVSWSAAIPARIAIAKSHENYMMM